MLVYKTVPAPEKEGRSDTMPYKSRQVFGEYNMQLFRREHVAILSVMFNILGSIPAEVHAFPQYYRDKPLPVESPNFNSTGKCVT